MIARQCDSDPVAVARELVCEDANTWTRPTCCSGWFKKEASSWSFEKCPEEIKASGLEVAIEIYIESRGLEERVKCEM